MAQAVHQLLDQLVRSLRPKISDSEFRNRKRSALHSVSKTRAARTNQFEVTARYEGLAEKLTILNKDEIADQLGSLGNDLSRYDWEWTPEALSLLLLLSDRPTNGTNLHNSAPPGLPDSKDLSPESVDAIEYSPLDDSDIWRNVDFANDGSDDEDDEIELVSSDSGMETDTGTPPTETFEAELSLITVPVVKADLDRLKASLPWNWQSNEIVSGKNNRTNAGQDLFPLSEVQIIRETIHMLLGLPTPIYTQRLDGLQLSEQVALRYHGPASTISLLNDFGLIGKDLDAIRHSIREEERAPPMQTFQFVVNECMQEIDAKLNAVQQQIINTKAEIVASTLHLYDQVYQITHSIRCLCPVIHRTALADETRRSFKVLEGLYDTCCATNEIGDLASYQYIAEIFFACFRTYLRSVRSWMEEGEITPGEQVMFVKRNNSDVPLESIWQDLFALDTDMDGTLRAPSFLHLASKNILNAGKSVDFLKRLGDPKADSCTAKSEESNFSLSSVCHRDDPHMLSPFPEVFNGALSAWIAGTYHSSFLRLRQHIEEQCDLEKVLDALEYLFFSRDGILSNEILVPMFTRLDGGRRYWDDAFTLTELYTAAFATTPQVDTTRLAIHSSKASQQRSMSVIEQLTISYTLPWPIANILRPRTLTTYQRVSTFLVQCFRARFLLQRLRLPPKSSHRSNDPPPGTLHQIYSIRLHLLHFTDTMLSHTSSMVLDVATAQMRQAMRKAEDMDAMIAVHTDYIAQLEDQCLLTQKHAALKQAIVAILDLNIHFSDQLKGLEGSVDSVVDIRRNSHKQNDGFSSDEEDEDADREPKAAQTDSESVGKRLSKIKSTFSQLHSFVAATVTVLSKADGAACWEVLASNLAAGAPK